MKHIVFSSIYFISTEATRLFCTAASSNLQLENASLQIKFLCSPDGMFIIVAQITKFTSTEHKKGRLTIQPCGQVSAANLMDSRGEATFYEAFPKALDNLVARAKIESHALAYDMKDERATCHVDFVKPERFKVWLCTRLSIQLLSSESAINALLYLSNLTSSY